MKNIFSKIAALGAMMLGAFTIHGAANKAPVAANAAGKYDNIIRIYFSSKGGEPQNWGGCKRSICSRCANGCCRER